MAEDTVEPAVDEAEPLTEPGREYEETYVDENLDPMAGAYEDEPSNTIDVNYVITHAQPVRRVCRNCKKIFTSNNKLHEHLRNICGKTKAAPRGKELVLTNAVDPLPFQGYIVPSNATDKAPPGEGFRPWKYATCAIRLAPTAENQDVCVDSGCTMTLINRSFLHEVSSDAIVKWMASPVKVRGIGDKVHDANSYVELDLHTRKN